MNQSVIIKESGIYHPEKIVNNEEFVQHFKSIGKDEEKIRELLKGIGRENRYIAEKGETTLSMAIEATKIALHKANMSGEDIDVFVFSSGTPEYLFPPNSLIIHNEIGGKREAAVYDSNSACVGMVVSLEQVSRSLLSNPKAKYALIVGSERMFHYAKKDNPFTYGGFGDAACAIILEKVEQEGIGFLDVSYNTDSRFPEDMMFPECGLSNILDDNIPQENKLFHWGKLNSEKVYDVTASQITRLLEKHNLTPKDIKQYLCTQVSVRVMKSVIQEFDEDIDKYCVIGDEFGYTGTSSPFIALQKAVENGKVQRGDYILFWSIGTGYTACALLMRY